MPRTPAGPEPASPIVSPPGPGVVKTPVEPAPQHPSPSQSSEQERGPLAALERLNDTKLSSLPDPLAAALELAVHATGSEVGYLHLISPEGDSLLLSCWSKAARQGCSTKPTEHFPLEEAGIWADCLRQGRPVIHNDYPDGCDALGLPEDHAPITRHMGVVVREGGRAVAVVGVGNRATPYSTDDGSTFELLMAGMWAVLQRHRTEHRQRDTVRRLRRLLGGSVEAITRAVEMGDPATAGHQRRVSDLARSIATELGLPPRQVDAIRLAAMLHDIGKLAVPADILTKPARLTRAQLALVRQHAQAGADILAPITYPEGLSQVVAQHHERLDGTGYPAGLEGDAIRIDARILAVADIVEAMLSHRPYRPAHTLEETLWEIRQQRDRQLDARVVDACLRLFEELGYRLPDPDER